MNRAAAIILLVIVMAGCVLRFWHIGADSYWYDEFGSLETSAGNRQEHADMPRQVILAHPRDFLSLQTARPVWKIWASMDEDFHPPLYFILLRFWRDIFGSSEAATRSLSAIAGILGIICIFDIGRLAHGAAAGLWAAAIFAVAGPQVVYAQETRGYMLVVLFGLCALDALVRIEVSGANAWRLAALATSTLAMMLTHYLGVPMAIALGVYALLRLRGKMRWQAAGALLAAGIIFAGAWGPFMPVQRRIESSNDKGFLAEGEWTPFYALQHLASLPVELLGPPVEKNISSTWPAAVVYFLPLLLIRRNHILLLWLFWLIGAVGLFALLDQIHPTHHFSFTRYILMAGPGFYLIYAGLLAAQAASPQRNWWMPHVLPALAVIFCLVSLPSSFAERRWPDWRAIAASIDRLRQPGDLLIFASDGKKDWFSGQYMSYAYYAAQKPADVLILSAPADAKLRAQMRRFPGAIIVNASQQKPEDLLPGYRAVRSAAFLPFVAIDRMQVKR